MFVDGVESGGALRQRTTLAHLSPARFHQGPRSKRENSLTRLINRLPRYLCARARARTASAEKDTSNHGLDDNRTAAPASNIRLFRFPYDSLDSPVLFRSRGLLFQGLAHPVSSSPTVVVVSSTLVIHHGRQRARRHRGARVSLQCGASRRCAHLLLAGTL